MISTANSVKGYFCSFLVSNIYWLTSLSAVSTLPFYYPRLSSAIHIYYFLSLKRDVLICGNMMMVIKGYVSVLASFNWFPFIFMDRLILAVFVCAVSHRTFSQNLKYISARISQIQENGGLPSGFYLYIGITSCAYKISQFFFIFNTECYLKWRIPTCAFHRFLSKFSS